MRALFRSLAEHELIDHMKHAALVVRSGDIVGLLKYRRLRVRHGDAKSCRLDHGQIVVSVAAADHLVGSQSDAA